MYSDGPTLEQFRANSPLGVASRLLGKRLRDSIHDTDSQTEWEILGDELIDALYDYGDAIARRAAYYVTHGY